MCALFKCPLWKLSANKGLVKIVERDASLYFSFGEHRSSGLCVWTHRWPVTNHSRGDRIINKTANETLDSALFSSHDVSPPSLTNEWQGDRRRQKEETQLEDTCTIWCNVSFLFSVIMQIKCTSFNELRDKAFRYSSGTFDLTGAR